MIVKRKDDNEEKRSWSRDLKALGERLAFLIC